MTFCFAIAADFNSRRLVHPGIGSQRCSYGLVLAEYSTGEFVRVRLKALRFHIGSTGTGCRTSLYGSQDLSASQVDLLASEKAEEDNPFGGQVGGVYHSLQRKGTAGVGDFRREPGVFSDRRNARRQAIDAL